MQGRDAEPPQRRARSSGPRSRAPGSGPAGGAGHAERRIVIDALTATSGGGNTVVSNLAGELAALRPQWHFVLLCSHEGAVPDPVPRNLEVAREPALASPLRRWLWQQLRLPAQLRRHGADLLIGLGGFACFTTRVPQIAVWQNPNVLSRERVARSWRTNAYIVAQRAMQRASLPVARFHVFQTADSVEMARARWPMARYPHAAIHWGADRLRAGAGTPPPLAQRERMALAVGHTYFHKDYETLIDAMGVYARRWPDDPLRLEIAGGPYDRRHHAALRERARPLGDRVLLRGALPARDVAALYRRARVYVTTSLLETFGLTTLEAMANGVPVVATHASCLPEVCGDAALYCAPRDAEDVARQLRRAVEDEALAEDLRARGLARVAGFTWRATAERFAAVAEQVLRDA